MKDDDDDVNSDDGGCRSCVRFRGVQSPDESLNFVRCRVLRGWGKVLFRTTAILEAIDCMMDSGLAAFHQKEQNKN